MSPLDSLRAITSTPRNHSKAGSRCGINSAAAPGHRMIGLNPASGKAGQRTTPSGTGSLLNTTSSNVTRFTPQKNAAEAPPGRTERILRRQPDTTARWLRRRHGRGPPASFRALPEFLHASPIDRAAVRNSKTNPACPNPPVWRIDPPGFSSPVCGVRVGE
jgi:hypothetical protein